MFSSIVKFFFFMMSPSSVQASQVTDPSSVHSSRTRVPRTQTLDSRRVTLDLPPSFSNFLFSFFLPDKHTDKGVDIRWYDVVQKKELEVGVCNTHITWHQAETWSTSYYEFAQSSFKWCRFLVSWKWYQGPQWGTPRTSRKQITRHGVQLCFRGTRKNEYQLRPCLDVR